MKISTKIKLVSGLVIVLLAVADFFIDLSEAVCDWHDALVKQEKAERAPESQTVTWEA